MTAELRREEIDEVLRREGDGVLSLADGKETYAIPESFGYDGENIYFQLVYTEDSEKMAFIETTDVATFTVYTADPAVSVLVRGTLDPVPEDEISLAATAIAENAEIPTLDVYPSNPTEASTHAFYRFTPDAVSGRKFEEPRIPSSDA